MSALSAYIGRTFDMAAFCCPVEGETVLLTQELFPEDGMKAVTGIQKLAQRWHVTFLTIRGSVARMPDEGSSFLQDVYDGNVRLPVDAFIAFERAKLQVNTQLWGQETDADPSDERLADAVLTNVVVVPGRLVLGVKIISRAGTSFTYLEPVNIMPGGDE